MSENLKSPICEIKPCGAGKKVDNPVVGKTYQVLFKTWDNDFIGWFLSVYQDETALENDWDWHIIDPKWPDIDIAYMVSVHEAVGHDDKTLEVV